MKFSLSFFGKKTGLLILLSYFFVSCESEFNPNGEWKEVTAVYGILDQDEDTTWVRIQKCFLGEGNMLEFAKVPDSTYYKDGELVVTLTEYEGTKEAKGKATGKMFRANRTVISGKQEGVFPSQEQPVYFFVTKGQLSQGRVYELTVENVKTKNVVSAVTSLIGDYQLRAPLMDFEFEKRSGNDRFTELKWSTNKSVLTYQPSYRFYYMEKDSPIIKHVDFTGEIEKYSPQELRSSFFQSTLFSLFKDRFTKENYPAKSIDLVDSVSIFINGADQELSDYIGFNNSEQGLQEKPIYTNVLNGIGIFASRHSIEQSMSYRQSTRIIIRDSLSYWFE